MRQSSLFIYRSGVQARDAMPSHNKRSKQAGNVFIIILLGVFLFGALMYSFSRSGQKGTGNLTKQQAKIAAQEILNYARLVEGAVDRVRRNGCSETEISFENSVVSGYENPNSPADNSCHIFEEEGGKISYFTPPEDWNDSSQSSELNYGELFFTGRTLIRNLGVDTKDDLIFIISWLPKSICESLNNMLFGEITITEDPGGWGRLEVHKFNGIYDYVDSGIDLSSYDLHNKQTSACYSSQSFGGYHFYHVLLAR